MGFLSRLLRGRRRRGSRSNPVRPNIPLFQAPGNSLATFAAQALAPSYHVTQPIPNSSGYILLTRKDDHDEQIMGRNLEFDSNRGSVGGFLGGGNWRGETEKVKLDGHTIWEGQIRNTSANKVRQEFFDEWDMQQLTRTQVQNILADEENDPQMYGQTADADNMMEAELAELRTELEEEYAEKFEEDYQRRFKQEYPGQFSKDFEEHYTDWVEDELDDVEEDYEELYEEYIVTPKHIRYKR